MKYGVVYADPPWPYSSPSAVVGRLKKDGSPCIEVNHNEHYQSMSMNQLFDMPIKQMSDDNAHLYLWTTNSFICEAHELARRWGFKPKTIISWVKVKKNDKTCPSMKCGTYYRSATEHLLFCVRGKKRLVGPCHPTATLMPRQAHSVKPDYFYEMIETQSTGPYLELFARRKRLGWDQFGNQVEDSIQLPEIESL